MLIVPSSISMLVLVAQTDKTLIPPICDVEFDTCALKDQTDVSHVAQSLGVMESSS